jgi:phosphoribosylanthranilate isomerase
VAADVAMATHKITGLGDPTNPQDAATRAWTRSGRPTATYSSPHVGVQLVDWVDSFDHEAIRGQLPGVKLVQVLHVEDDHVLDQARAAAGSVDALLLDSGRPNLPVRELGGTGRVHDWELSRQVVKASPVPVFLAGGLDARNVADAIARVRPFGVDVCTGVRTDGHLDHVKLRALISTIKAALAP